MQRQLSDIGALTCRICRAPLHKASVHGLVVVVKINPPPCATGQTVGLRDREGLRYPQASKFAGLEHKIENATKHQVLPFLPTAFYRAMAMSSFSQTSPQVLTRLVQ